ncbi:hypothetical protein CBM2592_B40248 [Cupriavidus taiwanensis]|nr:hypothetical protein CBM2592_B40248 [Cupriavidus taiwanensis]SOY72110.1 hypothetical protein CBM2588_B40065 [Cupriavidus taiwanensis]SOY95674.1 hypothetical protein CBM2591_B20245 [Cupriavidus taiwanensis]SOZ29966.1 hypothetical protein CBM2608_B30273 [Cupriavidus taiwanensis]SOZ74809.1 hypothetical protein CBM2617_B60160 [Cupriavidus taiwanensis]
MWRTDAHHRDHPTQCPYPRTAAAASPRMSPLTLRIQVNRRLSGDRSRKRTVVLGVSGRLIAHLQRSNGPELLPPPSHAWLRFMPRFRRNRMAQLVEQTLQSP